MTIRVGMIGAGAIADDHCNNINKYDGAEVVAVADLSRKRRKDLQTKHGIPNGYAKWEKIIADADCDAVAIALPNALHAPVSIAALNAGKHVLLDKPFALSYAEGKKVVATAKRKKKVLMLGMNQRYRQDAQMIKAIVDRGELGNIYHAKAYWYRRNGAPKFGTWFVNKKMSGGGCMLDIGVHYLDLALHLMGNWDPVSVSGQVYGKSDKTASAPLEDAVHPGQLLASIYHSVGINPETIVYNHLNQPREMVKADAVTALFG